MPIILCESLHNSLFLKGFQFSLWPVKKYAPVMPVYIIIFTANAGLGASIKSGIVNNCLLFAEERFPRHF